MPPNKMSMRKLCPSRHHSPHADPRAVIEQLFLLRRFEEALELSYGVLQEMCIREEDGDRFNKGKEPAMVEIESADPQEMIMRLRHSCKNPGVCGCSAIVVLVVQIMYEMGKSTQATPFACKFYGDISNVPYDIIFVCVNLLANSLEDFVEAKRILLTYLNINKINEQGLVTHLGKLSPVVINGEQREILFEFLLFHVLVPLNNIDEALAFLADDKTLSLNKKEGWTTYLNELSKSRLLRLQQQPEQPNAPASENRPVVSQNGQLVKSGNMFQSYYAAIVARSKQYTNNFWIFLCSQSKSRLGFVAFGVAVFLGAVYILAAMRRRRAKRTEEVEDIPDGVTKSTTTRTVNNKQLTKPKPNTSNKVVKQRMARHYGDVEQVKNHNGFWSSVTELISGALSFK